MFRRKNKEPKLSRAEKKKLQEEAERFGNEMVESYRKQMDELAENFRKMLKENLANELQKQKDAASSDERD